MNLLTKIAQLFTSPVPDPEPDVLFPGLVTAKQFSALKPDQRMQAVIIVGDATDEKHYSFLKWCIEKDLDPDVRFATLKRLPNFKTQKDLHPFLMQLDRSARRSALEPYLSMSLSRAGLIDEQELRSRLNGG